MGSFSKSCDISETTEGSALFGKVGGFEIIFYDLDLKRECDQIAIQKWKFQESTNLLGNYNSGG